ncbi:MAG: glutaredoxin family protein [Mycobacteriaceae bacterium]
MSDDGPAAVPTPDRDEEGRPKEAPIGIDVYWRPRCFFCFRLRRALRRTGIATREHNIWKDRGAREFVRWHANGTETVPTVVVGNHVFVNPRPRTLLAELRRSRAG